MATAAYSTLAPEDGADHRTRRAVEAYIEWLISLLDDLDDDPDLEPSFTSLWDKEHGFPYGASDEMEEGVDAEPDLGWCNNVCQLRLDVGGNYGDGDSTAPERHGAGFIRCAPDDCEDSHDAEAVDEDGDESDVTYEMKGEMLGGCLVGADQKNPGGANVGPF